jgi:hypothetical protein
VVARCRGAITLTAARLKFAEENTEMSRALVHLSVFMLFSVRRQLVAWFSQISSILGI